MLCHVLESDSTFFYFNALHWRKQPKKTMRLIRDCLHSAPSSSTPIAMSARSQGTASMTAHSPDAGGSTKTLQKALMDAKKVCWKITFIVQ